MSLIRRIITITSAVLLVFMILVLLFNLFMNISYFEFYSGTKSAGEVAGLNDGLIQQGIDYVEEEGALLTSGYMNDDSASRIYVTKNGKTTYTRLIDEDGDEYTGHAGGITHHGEYLYVGNKGGVDVFPLADILLGKDTAQSLGKVSLTNTASWVTSHDGYLYAGKFAEVGKDTTSYPADDEHIIENPNNPGEYNCSIVSVYRLDATKEFGIDNSAPVKILSTTSKVQGGCFTEDGTLILSTSWGLNTSRFYFYNVDLNGAPDASLDLDGKSVPLYYLGTDKLVKTVRNWSPVMFSCFSRNSATASSLSRLVVRSSMAMS